MVAMLDKKLREEDEEEDEEGEEEEEEAVESTHVRSDSRSSQEARKR